MDREEKPFLGRGWRFPPRFDAEDGRVNLVSAEEDIRQSLRILLSTFPGERVMRSRFGLDPSVFGRADETSINDLKARIRAAILRYERRIRLVSVTELGNRLEGIVHFELIYEIPETNTRGNLVVPFYLREGAGSAIAGIAEDPP